MKTMVVATHFDDEVISCGGLIQARLSAGNEVMVLVAHGRVYDYGREDGSEEEHKDFLRAMKVMGFGSYSPLMFPEGEPAKVGYYTLLEKVEMAIRACEPDELVGPSPLDLNQDHRHLSHVLDIAMRPTNLGGVCQRLEAIGLDGTSQSPNYFVTLDDEMLRLKQAALTAYSREVRSNPSPRSPENLEAQARVWGAKVGETYAEAYHVRMIKE